MVKVWKVNVPGFGSYITANEAGLAYDRQEAADECDIPPDKVLIEELEMSQEELDALPEFDGF